MSLLGSLSHTPSKFWQAPQGRVQLQDCRQTEKRACARGTQLREITLALRSGLPGVVPWALNVVGLASFQARSRCRPWNVIQHDRA